MRRISTVADFQSGRGCERNPASSRLRSRKGLEASRGRARLRPLRSRASAASRAVTGFRGLKSRLDARRRRRLWRAKETEQHKRWTAFRGLSRPTVLKVIRGVKPWFWVFGAAGEKDLNSVRVVPNENGIAWAIYHHGDRHMNEQKCPKLWFDEGRQPADRRQQSKRRRRPGSLSELGHG